MEYCSRQNICQDILRKLKWTWRDTPFMISNSLVNLFADDNFNPITFACSSKRILWHLTLRSTSLKNGSRKCHTIVINIRMSAGMITNLDDIYRAHTYYLTCLLVFLCIFRTLYGNPFAELARTTTCNAYIILFE